MVVDTSVLVAVILGEPEAESLLDHMSRAETLIVSAATLLEASIVVESRQGQAAADDLQALLADLEADLAGVTDTDALAAIAAWHRFGKGRHAAGLNFGDCFSYACAKVRGESLLFKGADFGQTDIATAI